MVCAVGRDLKELAEKVRTFSGDAMGQAADQAEPTDPCSLPSFLSASSFSREMEEPGLMEVTRQKPNPAGN